MDEIIKVGIPLIALIYWVLRCRAFAAPKVLTLYITLFGVLSANFTLAYREVFQIYTIILLALSLILLLKYKIILKPVVYLFAFIGSIIISLFFNGLSENATINLINILVITGVLHLFFIMLSSTIQINSFFDFYLEFALFLSILAPIDYFILGHRAEGTFSNPNYYGYFLGLILPWSILSGARNQRWLAFGFISAAIFLTGSRAAILVIPLTVGFYFLRLLINKKQKNIKVIIYSISGIFTIITIALFTDQISQLLLGGRDTTDLAGSDTERFYAIEAGIAMFKDSMLYGIGWGRYIDFFPTYLDLSNPIFSASNINTFGQRDELVSHNDFIRVLSELGLIGSSIFMLTIASSFHCIIKYTAGYKYFLMAALAGSLAYSVTHNNMNSLLFWLILLLPLSFKRIIAKSPEIEVPKQ